MYLPDFGSQLTIWFIELKTFRVRSCALGWRSLEELLKGEYEGMTKCIFG